MLLDQKGQRDTDYEVRKANEVGPAGLRRGRTGQGECEGGKAAMAAIMKKWMAEVGFDSFD